MAENSEERKVRIVVDAMQATASAKEMGAGLAVLKNQLDKMAEDDPNRAKLQDDFARLNQRLTATRAEMRTVIQTEEELAAAHSKLVAENREVILNGQKVEATFGQMKAAATLLEKQLDDLAADDPGRAKLLADYRALKDRIEDVKKEMGEATDQGLTFKDALAFAGVAVTAEAALDMIKELGAEVIATTKELGKMRADINSLTGASGAELDQLTVGVRAVSQAFGKEYNEVLVASNALSKQMGISQQESLRLIEQGFIAGADASGEFLDQVKEYGPQFKAVGLSANEAVGMISQSITTGVFSDKGADLIKEFGLRISEQTKSTSDAMEAAFGTEFTQKLFKGINDGSISSAQALQRVAQQMDETKIPANQLQTVIADVFGGPGEDAGLAYIQSLKNVTKGVDELVDSTNPYVQQQQALLASQKELAGAQNELAKQFEGTGNSMQVLANEGMTFLYTLLVSLGATFRELYEPIQQIWKELLELGESMGLVSKEGSLAKDIANGLGTVLRLLFTPTRLVYEGFSLIAKGLIEWVKQSEPAKAAVLVMIAPLRLLFDMLRDSPAFFEGFSAAAQASFGQVGKAWRAVLRGDFTAAGEELATIGGAAGRAYLNAFDAARASRPAATATAAASGGEEPGTRPGAGGDGTTQEQRDKAAKDAQAAREKERKERKAAQDKADQERLNDLKRFVQDELVVLDSRDTLRAARDVSSYNDEQLRREQQRQKLFEAATAQVNKLTGLELDYTDQVKAIVAERDLSLRELQGKFEEEDEKRRQEALDKKIAQTEADKGVRLSELELQLAEGVLSEQAYQDAVFAVKQAAMERELELVKQKSGEESDEYKKLLAEKNQGQADYTAKQKSTDQVEQAISQARRLMESEEMNLILSNLNKKSLFYKAAMALQKSLALAEIAMSVPKQWAANAEAGAKISASAPPFTVPLGVAYTVGANIASTVGAGVAAAKIMGIGFRKGGATGTAAAAESPLALSGFQIGANGKLLDAEGYAVAGVVHENEYVIPEWMRADPQVVRIEEFLEQKRLRGYLDGGPTSADVAPAGAAATTSAGADQLLVQVLGRLDSRLQGVEQWQRELAVYLEVQPLEQTLEERDATRKAAEIR